MRLDDAQVEEFERKGWIVLPAALSAAEVAVLEQAVEAEAPGDGPWLTRERNGRPHVIYGAHQRDERIRALARHPRLVEPMRQLLGQECYIHQSRINMKQTDGSYIAWHQDFGTYHRIDGIPEPRGIMSAVFLDEVNPCNAPILAIPGSHREGLVSEARIDPSVPDADQAARFRYDISPEAMQRLVDTYGIEPIMGPAGSLLFMNMTVVHGSAANITPLRRLVIYLNTSAIDNRGEAFARPPHYATRDFTPLVSGDPDCLLAFRTAA